MIPLFKPVMHVTAANEVAKVLNSGFLGQGKVNEEFEDAIRRKLGHHYINTTNAATAAEHLAFRMLKLPHPQTGWQGLDSNSEVLTASLTCLATHCGPLINGLKLKWIDIDPTTLNVDLDDLERKISLTTRVINVVHWGGYPIDLDRLKNIQQKTLEKFGFKPAIVEDCAHALGSKYKGKYVGTHGNLATFSLQAIKMITAGDGGFLSCPNQDLYNLSRKLRWFGIDRDDPSKKISRCDGNVEMLGDKLHMNDINSAIGLANLPMLDDLVWKHKDNANFYDALLDDVPGLTLLKRQDEFDSAFWLYSILVENKPSFTKWMAECGIEVNHAHQRTDFHTCMDEFKAHLPALDSVIDKMTNIPVGSWVTAEQRSYIVDCIKKGW